MSGKEGKWKGSCSHANESSEPDQKPNLLVCRWGFLCCFRE